MAQLFRRLLCLVAVLGISLPAFAGGLDRVRKAGVLRWAGDLQGGEPYVFQDPRDPSRIVGFEVEIADGIAKRLGVKAEFVQNDWKNLVPSLERGDFDVVLNGLEDMPSVRDRILVSRPYFTFSEQLVVRKGAPQRSLQALSGHKIGTLASSLAHAILRGHPDVQTVLYEGVDEPYRDLELGRVDGVLLDSVIARRFGLSKPDLMLADGDVARGAYVLGIRHGEEDLRDAINAALEDMEKTGELGAILARWDLQSLSVAPRANDAQLAPDVQAHFDAGQWLLFLKGALVTLLVSLLAMALAVPLGLLLALARLYGGRITRGLALAYIEAFRGTPVLLQLYLLYYGLAPVVHLNALTAAILGLGLNYGAYEAEVHRGALGSVPVGQTEASSALGLSRFQTLRLVLLPQALRTALPAMTNDLISLLKDSSLVSVITVVELTKQMTITAVDVRSWALPGLVCAGLYFAMSYPLARLAGHFEARLSRSEPDVVPAVSVGGAS